MNDEEGAVNEVGIDSLGQGWVDDRLAAACDALVGVARVVAGEARSADRVAASMAKVRLLQRLTAGVAASLTQAVVANQRAGVGPVAEEVLGGGGTVGRAEVRAEVDRAATCERFDRIGAALGAGAAHPGNVDVLARTASRMTDAEVTALAEHDGVLAEAAGRLSEESFRKRVQRLRDNIRADHGATAAEQAAAGSFARISPDRDRNGYRVAGWLDPLRGAAVQAALMRECRWLSQAGDATAALDADQIMAQALHDLILRGDATDRATGSARANVSVVVVTDRQTLGSGPHGATTAETDDGMALDPSTVGRLCCDATLRRVDGLGDAGVYVSRPTRTATAAQRAGLRAMYPGCAISGVPWSQCEVHHTVPYAESKRTVLPELVPISRRWHHLVHEGGWTLTMDENRTLRLSRPDGTHHRTIPHRPAASERAA